MDPSWTFFSIDIEISNRCELGCQMCPRSSLVRPSGWMEPKTFGAIMQKVAPLRSRIALSGLGNPLGNPHWPEFVGTYRKTGGPIGLVIHASHLTADQSEKLLEVQPSFLEISFPSADEKHFGTLCPASDYRTAKESLLALAKNPKRRFPIVVVGLKTQINPDEESLSKDHWRQHGLTARIFPCHSRAGALDAKSLIDSPLEVPVLSTCGLLAIHAFVTWQGKLLSCCHDLRGECELGDFQTDSLEVLMARKMELVFQTNPFAICQRCDDPFRLVKQPLGPFPSSARQRHKALRTLVGNALQNR